MFLSDHSPSPSGLSGQVTDNFNSPRTGMPLERYSLTVEILRCFDSWSEARSKFCRIFARFSLAVMSGEFWGVKSLGSLEIKAQRNFEILGDPVKYCN